MSTVRRRRRRRPRRRRRRPPCCWRGPACAWPCSTAAPTAATPLSTHALMRAGVLQLPGGGCSRMRRRGRAAGAAHGLPLRDGESVRVPLQPAARASTRCTHRGATVLDRLLVDAAAEAGAECRHRRPGDPAAGSPHARRVTGVEAEHRRRPHARAPGRDHGRRRRDPLADGGRGSAPTSTAGRSARERPVPLPRPTCPPTGYEWFVRRRGGGRADPDQRRRDLCSSCATTGSRCDRLRRTGVEHAFATLLAAAGPAVVDRVRAAPGRRVRCAGGPGGRATCAGHRAPGGRWSATPGYFKDPLTAHGMTRRPARRRAARATQSWPPRGTAPTPRTSALRGVPGHQRDRLSAGCSPPPTRSRATPGTRHGQPRSASAR